jgi:RNase adapter protein RapZ
LQRVAALRTDHRVTLVFLDASTSELVRRYDATRRKHPLAGEADGLVESIELERSSLQPLREAADLVIDTTGLNVHQLKERVVSAFSEVGAMPMQIAVESFGYKHGLPMDADIVMDATTSSSRPRRPTSSMPSMRCCAP